MKLIHKRVGILFLCLVLGFSSCSSDDNGDPETFIKFKINDTSYLFKDIISVETNSTLSLNGNNGLGISNPGDTQIAVLIPADFQLGSFEVSGDFFANHKIIFSSNPLGFDNNAATNGSLNITSTSGEFVKGVFSVTVTNSSGNTIILSDGEFKGFKVD
ncbi:MAG: hypothetical protein ACK4RM_02380 [Flavobacterium sp.]